ncbi:FMN-binding glutamate synthase family protein [Psychrobacter sanguinis]|uniref:FMN-binding glutamate synthase family protein n=1 Tax=Psychrobacter sanguinis TaxID=861445 RepID=UPI00020C98CB|nr:FMN-binding glutamate synthase family protein [Psychrobacter sanguinis]EGK09233.1 glutamate synthase domain protein [Psychrobacter sp. 1501(2011)]MCC3307029.1 FMN-binding glutamate synthase family protein [Psychrobacter sanguinis]MCD9152319.1 FMN-binding glutamate synthase family protein [Psychrobacter sanguinis]MDY3306434.1 FMN-binding glutamate synthase family protein [Psychrobacter sanguinis]UEC24405.1 FMN-binding glutamate synthase family protein [Psychrobacter sanguinis]
MSKSPTAIPAKAESTERNERQYQVGVVKRYGLLITVALITIISLLLSIWWLALVAGILVLVGIYDLMQSKHSVLYNYPIAGHIRYFLESYRPEIRQYFIENDKEEVPFSRQQRALVYQRAKNVSDTNAFGTLDDLYAKDKEWFLQSQTSHPLDVDDFRIMVGNERCQHPYSMSVFNISAMSFGSLSGRAIMALNQGAKMGGFAHDTGEGAISPYHRKYGGDLIWQLGTGYFGCRDEHGNFDPELFEQNATDDQVKMIEIKLSQGAKPGKGGVLPAEKITKEIALTRRIPMTEDCISPSTHSAFNTPRELVHFWQKLRDLSGGKPVGIKLCIGQPWQFMAIVKAMIEEDNYPDFIVVDGAEGGTGAAPVEFMDSFGMPLIDGFLFVHNTLVGSGIRDKIKIGVSGKIVSAFDIAKMLALGADWCNSARGFMFAVGCIQSRSCHTNTCPTGVATQDPYREKALDVPSKAERVASFHKNTIKSLANFVGAVGLSHPYDLHPYHVARRMNDGSIKLLSRCFYFIDEGALLTMSARSEIYNQMWVMADPDSFKADNEAYIAYNEDSRDTRRMTDPQPEHLQFPLEI